MSTVIETALVPTAEGERFMPVLAIESAKQRYNALVEFTKSIMKQGHDYGAIPGTDKPTLLKAGAEKLMSFFGLTVEDPIFIERTEDWLGTQHGGEPFFHYTIMQRVSRSGTLIASQVASINSWEYKYRYRWVKASDVPPGMDKSKLQLKDGSITEFAFAVDKAETSGPYGKPAEYWQRFKDAILAGTAVKGKRPTRNGKEMDSWTIGEPYYRVPNDRIFDQVNTLIKMCEKRALVAATLIATNASEHFTQDLEDLDLIDTGASPFPTPRAASGATMDDFTKPKTEPVSGKPVGVKHAVGNVDAHGDPPDVAAEQEGVPAAAETVRKVVEQAEGRAVQQPAGTVGELSGALANANAVTPDTAHNRQAPKTLATRDGVRKIEDRPPTNPHEDYNATMQERSDRAMERESPTDPIPMTENEEVQSNDELTEYENAVKSLMSLGSCKEFHKDVVGTLPGAIRPKVLVMLLRRQMELETSIVACKKIAIEHPELKEASLKNEQRIRDSRGQNSN